MTFQNQQNFALLGAAPLDVAVLTLIRTVLDDDCGVSEAAISAIEHVCDVHTDADVRTLLGAMLSEVRACEGRFYMRDTGNG